MKCALCGTENDDKLESCQKCGCKLNNNPVADKLKFNSVGDTINDEKSVNEDVTLEEIEVEEAQKDYIEQPVEEVGEQFEEEHCEQTSDVADSVNQSDSHSSCKTEDIDVVKKEIKSEISDDNNIEEVEVVSVDGNTKKVSLIFEKVKSFFFNFKENHEELFIKRNYAIVGGIVAVIILIIVLSVVGNIKNSYSRNKVVFESVNTIYVNDPKDNDTEEITTVPEDFDLELVKSSGSNDVFYYPTDVTMVNGIITFDIIKDDLKNEEIIATDACENFEVSYDGKYVVYFKNIQNLYGEDVGDLYVYNKKTGEELLASEVVVDSIKISSNSKKMMYISGENREVYKHTFGKNKPKKIDSDIDEVLYISDDLESMFYTKPQKQIDDFYVYSLYSMLGDKTNKLDDNVVKDSIHYSYNGAVYLTAPKSYPDFSVFDEVVKDLSRKEVKVLREEYEKFCAKNFFSLCQVDIKGNNDAIILDNVYRLNYVANNGSDIIATRFKSIDELGLSDVQTVEDLITPKNLETVYIDVNREIKPMQRVNSNSVLEVDENFAYSDANDKIYLIDGNELVEMNLNSSTASTTTIDTDVKELYFDNNTLIYLQTDGTLVEINGVNEPEVVDDTVIEDSIIFDNNIIYYQKQNDDKIELYAKIPNKRSKKLSDDLSDDEIVTFENYIYFFDNKDGLCMYNGKKVKKIDKLADEINLIAVK